jgi:hypothetical protein
MMRLTADQTAEMIKVAAKPPPQRAQMSRSFFYLLVVPLQVLMISPGLASNPRLLQPPQGPRLGC